MRLTFQSVVAGVGPSHACSAGRNATAFVVRRRHLLGRCGVDPVQPARRSTFMMQSSAQVARTLPSSPASARQAREFVSGELRRLAAGADVVDDLDLIVSELMANSIQHGDGGDIVVRVDAPSAKWFSITVTNGVAFSLPPMDPSTWKVAATDLPSGRGLGIVRRLADEIAVTEAAGLVHVTGRRRR